MGNLYLRKKQILYIFILQRRNLNDDLRMHSITKKYIEGISIERKRSSICVRAFCQSLPK